jgi:enamine deaminase RidA (YjgF/YER057c/UK114 family)
MVTRISTGSPFEKTFGYSRAVIDGDMIYISGTTGYDYARMVMPEDAGQQAENAFKTIESILIDAGSSRRDVVRVRYYLTDHGDEEAVVAVAGRVFAGIRPAATMVFCGLIRPEMKVEIEVTARIGAGD